jgi:hypothetical protein
VKVNAEGHVTVFDPSAEPHGGGLHNPAPVSYMHIHPSGYANARCASFIASDNPNASSTKGAGISDSRESSRGLGLLEQNDTS